MNLGRIVQPLWGKESIIYILYIFGGNYVKKIRVLNNTTVCIVGAIYACVRLRAVAGV